jgi:outer membrane protein OmpA-like peptidoglycan-associated protein
MPFVEGLCSLGRRYALCAGAGVLALGLAACSGDDEAIAGSPFTQALSKDYIGLASQASALPREAVESSFWDALNPFSSGDTTSDRLASAFAAKAELADEGAEPDPEAAVGPFQSTLRARLMRALSAGKDQHPEPAARAQADYDCWVLYGTVPAAATASQACKAALDISMVALENAARPVLPPSALATAPLTADLAAPPTAETTAAAPSAQAVNRLFTVYFDFDSWTLKAEQLKVLDDVIGAARAGGQSNINIVGHTDTSGPADYNQALSVRRANVVVEALAQMGARRSALHASGVGETALAVETGDGVKEARNRRTVVTMQP